MYIVIYIQKKLHKKKKMKPIKMNKRVKQPTLTPFYVHCVTELSSCQVISKVCLGSNFSSSRLCETQEKTTKSSSEKLFFQTNFSFNPSNPSTLIEFVFSFPLLTFLRLVF